MIPRLPRPLLELVQQAVLQVRHNRREEGHRDKRHDDGPARVVQRCVLSLEHLAANDAGNVRAHNEDGHGHGPLARGACVEGHPCAVGRVWEQGRLGTDTAEVDGERESLRQLAWKAIAVARMPKRRLPLDDPTRRRFPSYYNRVSDNALLEDQTNQGRQDIP